MDEKLEKIQQSNEDWFREAVKEISEKNTTQQIDWAAGYWTACVMQSRRHEEITAASENRLLKTITALQDKRRDEIDAYKNAALDA